jgi:hypothetical protein
MNDKVLDRPLFFGNSGLSPAHSPSEIDARLKRRYLDRLALRVKKMRKQLLDRDWDALRAECAHLGGTGKSFGLVAIAERAENAAREIPSAPVSKLLSLPQARNAVEHLILTIEIALSDNNDQNKG